MLLRKIRLRTSVVFFACMIPMISCGKSDSKSDARVDRNTQSGNTAPLSKEASAANKGTEKSNSQDCSAFRAATGTGPQNPSELISLINSLPRPVTLPCIITSLPRPLALHLTSSELSVQPAVGKVSPRILVKNSNLILTIATSGAASKVLEFGFLLNARQSVKGEIALPVTRQLEEADPYLHVAQRSANGEVTGTSCRACHLNEAAAGAGWPKEAFVSDAFAPTKSLNVRLDTMPGFLKLCSETKNLAETDLERCQILQAIFSGDVTEATFPGMKTMLESF